MKFLSDRLGIRNSDSTTIFLRVPKYWKHSYIVFLFRGLEILSLSFVVWGVRNSESFPVLFGGSEILNLLCCLGIRNSESSPVLFGGSEILNPLLCCSGDQKFWISCVVFGVRNSFHFRSSYMIYFIYHYDSYIGYFFFFARANTYSGFLVWCCVLPLEHLGYILPLRLLSSLNVGFYRDWRDQRPQFKFVYYLWPKLSQMNDL